MIRDYLKYEHKLKHILNVPRNTLSVDCYGKKKSIKTIFLNDKKIYKRNQLTYEIFLGHCDCGLSFFWFKLI